MLLKFDQCQATPWKNGLGSTFQRYIFPLDANLDNFDVRISMARVQTTGPFSIFNGVDRYLAVLEGNGLRLTFANNPTSNIANPPAIELTQTTTPYAFKGEWSIDSELMSSQVLDFNVMVRRGVYQAIVTQCQLTTGNLPGIKAECQVELMVLFLADVEYLDEAANAHSMAQYDLLTISSDIISQWTFKQVTRVIITQLFKCVD